MKFSGSKSTVLVKAFINVAVNTLFEFLYEIKFSSLTIKLIKQMHTDGNSQTPKVRWKDNDLYISVEEMQNMSNENCIQHTLIA